MRKLANGRILARRIVEAHLHPYYEPCRKAVVDNAALEVEENAAEFKAAVEWEAESGEWDYNHSTYYEDLESRFPGPDRRFVIASAYELYDAPGAPPVAIALKAYQVQRRGSWKDCEDYWLVVRPDGRHEDLGSLEYCGRWIAKKLDDEAKDAAAARADMAALADLR